MIVGAQAFCLLREFFLIGGTSPLGRFFDPQSTGEKVQFGVRADLGFLLQIASPGLKLIDPCGKRINVTADLGSDKHALPTIVHEQFHRRFAPIFFLFAPEKQAAGNDLVAVGEHVGFYRH